jgi:hypothetical protein
VLKGRVLHKHLAAMLAAQHLLQDVCDLGHIAPAAAACQAQLNLCVPAGSTERQPADKVVAETLASIMRSVSPADANHITQHPDTTIHEGYHPVLSHHCPHPAGLLQPSPWQLGVPCCLLLQSRSAASS